MLACQFSPEKKEKKKKSQKHSFLQKAAVRNLNRLICGYPERENKLFEGISYALLWRLLLRLQSAAFQSGAIRGLPLAATWRCASPRRSRDKTNAQARPKGELQNNSVSPAQLKNSVDGERHRRTPRRRGRVAPAGITGRN